MPPVPKHIRVSQTDTGLKIYWRRSAYLSGLAELFMLLFALAFFGLPFLTELDKLLGRNWAAFGWSDLVMLLFILLGGAYLYRVLTLLTNTNVIEVTPQQLTVRSGPLPTWDVATPTLPRQTIVQVSCENKTGRSTTTRPSNPERNFGVYARLTNGQQQPLLTQSVRREPADFVAETLNTFLKDHPYSG